MKATAETMKATMTTKALWASLLAFCKDDEQHLLDLLTEVYNLMQQASNDAQKSDEFPEWADDSLEDYYAQAEKVLADYGWDAEAEALALRLLRPTEQYDSQDIAYGEWVWSGNEPSLLGLS
jgi:hypothetical protein